VNTYLKEISRCQKVILLRAVIDCSGNISRAADELGIHRNTVRRVLLTYGYNSETLRRLAKPPVGSIYRKPLASVGIRPADEKRMA
jgi:DNA-directed RNA polymerase subunit N (RpoN/RPB10)